MPPFGPPGGPAVMAPVRPPGCVPESPGACGAGYIEESVSHCCGGAPRHEGVHHCRCGREWEEVGARHVDGACGVVQQLDDVDHECMCRLGAHSLMDGVETVHSCVHCGGPWVA